MDLRKLSYGRARRRAAVVLARILLGPRFDLKLIESISSNSVFLATSGQQKIIIRIGAADAYHRFRQAALAMKEASRKGVPVPKVIITGRDLVPCAYQITEFIPGETGDKFKEDTLKVWTRIGQAAAKINEVRTSGLEYELFSRVEALSWQSFINQKINELKKFWPTYRHWKSHSAKPFFNREELTAIFAAMEPLKSLKPKHRSLIHIDLAPRNVLVDDKGQLIAVLDWDGAKSFPPEHQVATSTFWLTTAEEKAFKEGYHINYDPRIVLALKLYEYLTQIPFKPLKIANTAHDIILWRIGHRPPPDKHKMESSILAKVRAQAKV